MTFECRCEEGQVHLYEVRKTVTYVCPLNGTLEYCESCECPQPHRCEVLAPEGRTIRCFTHDRLLEVAG
jgi:hypothetical protein